MQQVKLIADRAPVNEAAETDTANQAIAPQTGKLLVDAQPSDLVTAVAQMREAVSTMHADDVILEVDADHNPHGSRTKLRFRAYRR